jgi:multiple sugar transport system permease protein
MKQKGFVLPDHLLKANKGIVSLMARIDHIVDRYAAWLYPTPALIVLIVLFAIPIVYTVYLSFHFWNLSPSTPPVPIGIDNYIEIFSSSRFWNAVMNTFYFSSLSLVIQIPLALGIAMLLNRNFFGRGLVRTFFLFPMMATPVSSMIGWRMMLDPNSGIFGILVLLGFPRLALLSDPTWSLPTFVLADTWRWTPFVSMIMLSGLSSLPEEPYEAAVIDGASSWQLFRHITLPLLRSTIMVAVVFRVIDSLKVFDTIFVLSGIHGGVLSFAETLNIYSYYESFEYFHTGYASSLLVVFFLIVFGISLVLAKFRRSSSYE